MKRKHHKINGLVGLRSREKVEYMALAVFLFATPKHEDRERWVAVLNWLIEETNMSANRQLNNLQTPDPQSQ